MRFMEFMASFFEVLSININVINYNFAKCMFAINKSLSHKKKKRKFNSIFQYHFLQYRTHYIYVLEFKNIFWNSKFTNMITLRYSLKLYCF